MKEFITKNDRSENVKTALELLIDLGIKKEKINVCGYSETNGVSVYFTHSDYQDEVRIRVSDHGISNVNRMQSTFCFSFDTAKSKFYSFKSAKKINTIMAKNYKLIK